MSNYLYGVDISEKSLEISRNLNIYSGLSKAKLGEELEFEDNSFDSLISSGVFTRNQVPIEAFTELIRILKPNSFFIVVLRVEDDDFYYKPLKNYCQKNVFQEISKTRVNILKTCSRDILILQKC